jgi:glycine C-acetyltransferase
MGATGRGTHEHRGVLRQDRHHHRHLGKALGGASGGFTAAPARGDRAAAPALAALPVPTPWRRRSWAPRIAVLDLLEADTSLRDRLADNTRYFRAAIAARRLRHPSPATTRSCRSWCTTPCWRSAAARLLDLGVYVVGFFFPVVPRARRASGCR